MISALDIDFKTIRKEATAVREAYCAKPGKAFDIFLFMEDYRNYMMGEHNLEVLEIVAVEEMHEHSAGSTNMITGQMSIREDFYVDAANGGVQGRVTLAHEFGHHWLHQGLSLQRVSPGVNLDSRYCVEDQADAMACEILLDIEFVKKNYGRESLDKIADRFGVPVDKLEAHIERLIRNGDIIVQLDLNI